MKELTVIIIHLEAERTPFGTAALKSAVYFEDDSSASRLLEWCQAKEYNNPDVSHMVCMFMILVFDVQTAKMHASDWLPTLVCIPCEKLLSSKSIR